MSEIPKWQASIQYLYPGEATSGRLAVYLATVYLAADVDAAIAAAEQRAVDEFRAAMSEGTWYRAGEEAGLAAAREAVAALDWSCDERQLDLPVVGRDDALAAIDNLRGES